MREREKQETLSNIQKPSDQTLSLVGKRRLAKVRHGKAAKSTLPSFMKTEPRGHLRTTAPKFLQQTLQLKVYTNSDRQPPVPVPTTTMTNTIPCSHAADSSPSHAPGWATPSSQMSDWLWEPQPFTSWLMLTFKNTQQKRESSLFICLGLWGQFSPKNVAAALQL